MNKSCYVTADVNFITVVLITLLFSKLDTTFVSDFGKNTKRADL